MWYVTENIARLGLNYTSQAWLSFTPLAPPWDHFHPLWVKRKPGWKWKVTQARAQALRVREEKIPTARTLLLFKAPAIVWALIQAHCCAEISRAPFGSRGMRQTPLLFWVQICGWIDAWPRLPSPLAVALCPLSHSTVYIFLSSSTLLFPS